MACWPGGWQIEVSGLHDSQVIHIACAISESILRRTHVIHLACAGGESRWVILVILDLKEFLPTLRRAN